MKIIIKTLFAFLSCFLYETTSAQVASAARYSLIPYPQQLTPRRGSFNLDKATAIYADENVLYNEIDQLREVFSFAPLPVTTAQGTNTIELFLDEEIDQEEGYILNVSAQKIVLKARNPVGVFRGIETLRQLAPVKIESSAADMYSISIPAVSIRDYPAYDYRGLHLDVARHFFSKEYVKKFIDRMSLYKFNKFHFHLTDDQGWRIEIKKYPLLTQNGAWREFNDQDSVCIERARETGNPDYLIDTAHIQILNGKTYYGGFYSQEDMKELVAYAAARHIDVIPEIDMPGHMNIAVQNYPFLVCGDTKWEKGNFSVPLCPCNEQTFEFAENVYKEIFSIFPYQYVHLGADEVNKNSWKKSAACKVMMDQQNIKNADELQSYFVHRMEKFFNDHGKKIIGWDEILEGGINSSAVIMYWRTWMPEAPLKAVENGNRVIMSPGEPLYFDALPNAQSLYNVYHMNVVPKGITEEQSDNIWGAQANTWTEYIPTEQRLEYLVYPRSLALAENVWTGRKDWKSFSNRLSTQEKRLQAMNISYRLPDIEGLLDNYAFVNRTSLNVKPPADNLTLRYTTDGSLPTEASSLLQKVKVDEDTRFKIAAFTTTGHRGDVYTAIYTKMPYAETVKKEFSGLKVRLFRDNFKVVSDMLSRQADSSWQQEKIVVPENLVKSGDPFGLIFTGYFNAPSDGIYTFYLNADDGAVLLINNKTVIDNDGLHSAMEKSGQVALKKGAHLFELRFIEGGGGYTLELKGGQANQTKGELDKRHFK